MLHLAIFNQRNMCIILRQCYIWPLSNRDTSASFLDQYQPALPLPHRCAPPLDVYLSRSSGVISQLLQVLPMIIALTEYCPQ